MMRLRLLLVRAHLVLGFTAGSLLACVGLSGACLAFRAELDRLLHPSLYSTSPAGPAPSLAAVAEMASRAAGTPVASIALPRAAGAPYLVTTVGGQEVFIAATGLRVQGMRDAAQAPLAILLRFHRTLLAGDAGRSVVGGAALILLALISSGLVLWLPRSWKLLKSRLVVRLDAPPARWGWDLHHAVGAYAALGLTVSATTGAIFAFKPVSQPLLGALTASPPPKLEAPVVLARPGEPLVTPDMAVSAALTRFPRAGVMTVHYPQAATETYRIDLRQPGDVHPNGRSLVWVDPHRGTLLDAIDPMQAPWGWRLYYVYNFPIHTGEALGIAGQALMAVTSLSPLVLFVTGFMIWRVKQRRASPAARHAKPAAPPA